MGTIALEGLEFFSYHGFYEEEQKIGNRYSIDVIITVDFEQAAITDKLSETVNYSDVYQIVAELMRKSHKLLEHIAYQIIQGIRDHYPRVEKIKVSVSKYNPPVGGVCERSRITLEG
ncbi:MULTISPECIES: dihydroneopterin aldolase [unclassified Siphonobacter]|uniref:dihydroneopterin aldolase n=1 Tax=unclassified Siphonobacter TaxID=2635712 RepID=UPI000CBB3150|nr:MULTISPECIES: dihydroneopterin aldolase [unclassified Siphonobacter]MDQ1086215.1 dihydroneopterin aldolase [Siphonobacter sp. SORGH_AS_1065]MDR6196497.1 dihydroneopterin aldolase [Siphonobacter sp. SORGH_AS_0500]PKK37600.1 dihydroneopterin aldolase [Siphonobacter sp. SORGH_AS_0500]